VISFSSVRIGRSLLTGLAATLSDRANQAVGDIARQVQVGAVSNAVRDTGSMAEGVYVTTTDGSDYGERTAAATDANPKVVILEEVTPDGPGEAIVGCAAGHSIYVEYGTRSMPAQPFLTPAAEAARGGMADAVKVRIESI